MNVGAFFGGSIRFVSTCFERNDHFLVALILEFSSFEASDNYVEDEVSQICSGTDPTEGPGRLSVEQPGSMCFRGGQDCMVDCLPNANDSPVCLATVQTTSPMPSAVASEPTPAPSRMVPVTTSTPSTVSFPTGIPTLPLPVDSPTNPPVPDPTLPPVAVIDTNAPTDMPMRLMPVFQPASAPTRRPSRPSKPTMPPSAYHQHSHNCVEKGKSYGYYGIGDCNDPVNTDFGQKYPVPESGQLDTSGKQAKKPNGGNSKKGKDKKGSKKDGKPNGSGSPSHDGYSGQEHQSGDRDHYGIGASPYSSSSPEYEVGYTYAQPRTSDTFEKAPHDAANPQSMDGQSKRRQEGKERAPLY
jgi:hypothetical protein